MFHRFDYASPIGALTLVSDGAGLCGLYFEQHKPGGPPAGAAEQTDRVIDTARRQLDDYFAGKRRDFDIALRAEGTPFQKRVWALLAAIPFGALRSYGDLARDLGAPSASRAVGAAVGRNPISILLPCHRIVGASGAITGYAGGVERKRFLLALEQEALAPSSPQRLC
ncbi:MAG: methylated-DNA--[protein]-cysteine S-methyltransferase [Caulobacterales bacterium]